MRFSLAMPREAFGVQVVRGVLGGALRALGVREDCVADILLAASEACANVVRHGGPAPRYEVAATVGDSTCVVKVADRGRGLAALPHTFPEAEAEEGRGIQIMRALVDEVAVDAEPGQGTVVCLAKHLDWDDDAAQSHREPALTASGIR